LRNEETIVANLLFLAVLLVFSAYFSGSEVALFSLNKAELLKFSVSQNRRERFIANLMARPDKTLVTILIGNLLANLMIPAISAQILLGIWEDYGHFIAIAVVTPLIIIFCDIIPKTITRSAPQLFSRISSPVLFLFDKMFAPVRNLLLAVNNLIIKIFRLQVEEEGVTEGELDMAIKMGVREGVIDEEEGDFIANVMRFSKKEARNIMIPRNQAVFIPYGSSITEAVRIIQETGLVRALVYKKDFDHVVGVLDARDLIPYIWGYKKARTINKLLYSVSHYPSTKELGELLTDFLNKKIQIAVVIDEYGGTAGVVTLNAILSELMGREFSFLEETYRPGIKKISVRAAMISGDMQIHDFNYEFNENLSSSESETIGGYIIEKMGRFPRKEDRIVLDRCALKVKKISRNRIELIEVVQGEHVK
jgi:CBS domain containing-hemolysin-like protein